jgi:hypothetical protein
MDEITNPRLIAERDIKSVLKKAHIPRMRATPVVPHEH